MAALPPALTDPNLRPSSSGSSTRAPTSHGRGGAGNINNSPPSDPASLETPTLKSEKYTTGRGGSGNMAVNSDPEAARRAQDVVANPRRESTHSTHVGRGGAANVFKPSAAEIEAAAADNKWESAVSEKGEEKERGEVGLADRGKEFLKGILGGKK